MKARGPLSGAVEQKRVRRARKESCSLLTSRLASAAISSPPLRTVREGRVSAATPPCSGICALTSIEKQPVRRILVPQPAQLLEPQRALRKIDIRATRFVCIAGQARVVSVEERRMRKHVPDIRAAGDEDARAIQARQQGHDRLGGMTAQAVRRAVQPLDAIAVGFERDVSRVQENARRVKPLGCDVSSGLFSLMLLTAMLTIQCDGAHTLDCTSIRSCCSTTPLHSSSCLAIRTLRLAAHSSSSCSACSSIGMTPPDDTSRSRICSTMCPSLHVALKQLMVRERSGWMRDVRPLVGRIGGGDKGGGHSSYSSASVTDGRGTVADLALNRHGLPVSSLSALSSA